MNLIFSGCLFWLYQILSFVNDDVRCVCVIYIHMCLCILCIYRILDPLRIDNAKPLVMSFYPRIIFTSISPLEVSLPCQAPDRIHPDQELCVLHPFVVVINHTKARDIPPTYSKAVKAVVQGKIEKSGMADHIWKEKRNHLPLWDEVKIIDRDHWRI